MHTHLISLYKKITAVIVLILFSFVLLTPTSNALPYDPKKRKSVIIPNDGDIDPWEENDVYDPPPDDDRYITFFNDAKIGIAMYLYFNLGWNYDIERFDDTPIDNINITTPDDCDKNSKQIIRNR